MLVECAAMVHPFLRDLRPTLHIAHRGGAALAPENTTIAFQLAVDRFLTDMLEIDVHATSDGELVVVHDATLDRCTDATGAVAELTWGQIATVDAGYRFTADGGRKHPFRGKGVRIPRLEQVLTAFPQIRFNVELKAAAPGVEDAFADVIRGAGAVARVCVGSMDDGISKRVLRALPDACHFYPRNALTNLVIGLKRGETAHGDDPYHVLDMPLHYGGARLIDTQLLFRAAQMGRWVNAWTVDEEADMVRLIGEQVGGIITDRPDVLRRVLDRRAGAAG